MITSPIRIRTETRYKEIKEEFENLFKLKGYSSTNNTFTSDVWFLNKETKVEERSLVRKLTKRLSIKEKPIINFEANTTSLQKVRKIIESINKKTKTINLLNDANTEIDENFKININDFIKRISDIILSIHSKIEHCIDNSRHYSSSEKISKISQIIEKIDNMIFFNETHFKNSKKSTISINLKRLEFLPEGEYSFKLVIKELDSKFNMIKHEKKIISGKKLKLVDPLNRINLYEMNLKPNDNTFQEVYLNFLDVSAVKEFVNDGGNVNLKTITIKQITNSSLNISKQTGKKDSNRQLFKRQNNVEQASKFRNQNAFSMMNNNRKLTVKNPISPEIRGHRKNTSEDQDNQLLYNLTETIYLPVEFDVNELSGTNLYKFGLIVEKNGEVYGTSEESFLEFLLLHSDSLLNIDEDIHSNYNTTVKIVEDYQFKYKPLYLQSNVILGIHATFNISTRKEILSRILEIYKDNAETIRKNEEILKDILNIFHEIKDKLLLILTSSENQKESHKKEEEKRENCCGGCSIF